MTIELRMPALSPTMEQATLAKWLVEVGDVVAPGDLIAEIETDKATMELEASDGGRIGELLIAEGTDEVKVGTIIALLWEDDGSVITPAPTAEPAVVAKASASASQDSVPLGPLAVMPAPLPDRAASGDAMQATPLARRIAEALGMSLAGIRGSGAGGRIVKLDLDMEPANAPAAAVSDRSAVVAAGPTSDHNPPAGVPHQTIRLSGMRRTIAKRLTLAKQTVPHFYLSIDCDIGPLLALRAELNTVLSGRPLKLSVNHFLIKALAGALEEVPEANVQFAGDEMYRFERVDVAMAVALESGLVTPVIRDVGSKRISLVALEAQALVAQARDSKLAPEQYQGGTVSVSNLGMFGIERIFPVINPPQAMILGVGAGQQRVRVVDGAPAVATMLTMTGSFDHRAIDGSVGARAMSALRGIVEEPIKLLA